MLLFTAASSIVGDVYQLQGDLIMTGTIPKEQSYGLQLFRLEGMPQETSEQDKMIDRIFETKMLHLHYNPEGGGEGAYYLIRGYRQVEVEGVTVTALSERNANEQVLVALEQAFTHNDEESLHRLEALLDGEGKHREQSI